MSESTGDRLAPAAFDEDVSAVAMLPTGSDPHGMFARRQFPATRDPDICVAVPTVITGDPDVTPARRYDAAFDDRPGRRGSDDNLFGKCGTHAQGRSE
jgi:hypothetical protein